MIILGGGNPAKPDFIITFNEFHDTIIVIECKTQLNKHESKERNRPKNYAVDGVLYYAKFLKEEYNVIAIAISGVNPKTFKSTTFHWEKNKEDYDELKHLKDNIFYPENYIKYLKGEKLSKDFSLEEIKETAISFNNKLAKIKITEKYKPLFIAGILIALSDEEFLKNYKDVNSFNQTMVLLKESIKHVLTENNLKSTVINNLTNVFENIRENPKFQKISLIEDGSITWYISQLELKIYPMMNSMSHNDADALSVFYHEFIKYAADDGKPLGMVLTPEHLTKFMCNLVDITRKTKVLDIACGSGSFLVSAMNSMLADTLNETERDDIKTNNIYGVELDQDLYLLSLTNMMIRGDGKSNIISGDCFDKDITRKLTEEEIDVGLLNPPYIDNEELNFVEHLLNILKPQGIAVVVVPLSCAIGTNYREIREQLFKNHTLEAVLTMPDEIFYPTAINTCVMVWKAHVPHNCDKSTFFARFKDDGFEKRKEMGRIDVYNRWENIRKEWLKIYHEKIEITEKSLQQCVNPDDEWLAEAHIDINYAELNENDFNRTINNYLAYLIKYDTEKPSEKCSLDNWDWFNLTDVFEDIHKAKAYHKVNLKVSEYAKKDHIPYITRKQENNGLEGYIIPLEDMEIEEGNSITAAGEGIKFFYHEKSFICGNNISVLKSKQLNQYTALFLTTVLNYHLSEKYCYGRGIILDRLKKDKIFLPSTKNNTPDWEYMEKYVKIIGKNRRGVGQNSIF